MKCLVRCDGMLFTYMLNQWVDNILTYGDMKRRA